MPAESDAFLPPSEDMAAEAMRQCLTASPDIYVQLNMLRDWVNAHYPDFELYLEDVWNEHQEGETRFEYILRSRKTLREIGPLGYDIYRNHRDERGVWHLDHYLSSVRLMEDPREILDFIRENQA